MPRRENRTTPKVISGFLYMEVGGILVGSSEWWQWLERGETFYVESAWGTFTARCEERPNSIGRHYWYAFRRYRTKLYKCYLGRAAELTMAHLVEAAQVLADRLGV